MHFINCGKLKYQVAASTDGEKNFRKHLVKHIFQWKNMEKVRSYLLKLISAMFNSFSGSVNIETLYFV